MRVLEVDQFLQILKEDLQQMFAVTVHCTHIQCTTPQDKNCNHDSHQLAHKVLPRLLIKRWRDEAII